MSTDYYSMERKRAFMSKSQLSSWLDCPAREFAIQAGAYKEEVTEALARGQLVDAMLTGDSADVARVENDPKYRELLFTKNGEPRAVHTRCVEMVARVKRDELFMAAINGGKQQEIEWKMFGVEWQARLDICTPPDDRGGILADLKTTASLGLRQYCEIRKTYVPYYEAFGYWTQIAVYREAYKSMFGAYPMLSLIATVTEQDPPDIDILEFATMADDMSQIDDSDHRMRIARELEVIEQVLPLVQSWKCGRVQAPRCDHPDCAYCRGTKVLERTSRARSVGVVEPKWLTPPTPDYSRD